MATAAAPHNATFIATDQYPAMLTGDDAAKFLKDLASPEAAQRAARMIELRRDELCDAVLDYIRQLESAAATSNLADIFGHAHEIRGLAATAGMNAVGPIADGLCGYLDGSKSQQCVADPAVIALHVDAIVRASSSAGEAKKFGSRIAIELGALVARKLGAVNAKSVKQT
jgi:chemotaxis protein histidine kinase CheA